MQAGDQKVRSALTEKQARQIWSGLQSKLGRYKSVDEGQATVTNTTFLVHFERGSQTLRIVLDGQGRMSGFRVD